MIITFSISIIKYFALSDHLTTLQYTYNVKVVNTTDSLGKNEDIVIFYGIHS